MTDTRYEDALARHRADIEAKKTPADRLRERLAYAKRLRAKADHLKDWVEALNVRIQRKGEKVTIQWRPILGLWTMRFGFRRLELSTVEVEELFTWMFDTEGKLRAHADDIEAKVAPPISSRAGGE